MSNDNIGNNNPLDSNGVITVARLLTHLRDPKNLLTYLVFSAWLKFMGIASHIPSIQIG